ncbi:MAG: hypothetical protein J5767_08635 [Paludibacteraceae bacterium]|nr:hypothetical protein [Paludibacteraceae bacterium]
MQYREYTDIIRPKTSNLILCFGIILLLWIGIIPDNTIIPVESLVMNNSPLAFVLSQNMDFLSFPFNFLPMVLLGLISYFLIWFNEDYSFISVRSILPAFFFIIISSLLFRPYAFITFIVILLVFFIIFSCFHLYENPSGSPSVSLFNTGLLLGVTTLFSLSCFSYILLLIVYYYRIKALSLKTFLAFIMGLMVPYLYTVGGFYFTGNITLLGNYFTNWHVGGGVSLWHQLSDSTLVYVGVVALLTIFSLVRIFFMSSHQTIKNRQESMFLVHAFLLTVIFLLLGASDTFILLPIAVFLASFLLGQAFSSEYNLVIKILLGIFIVSSVLFLIFPDYNWEV